MSEGHHIDAAELIVADLEAEQRTRRRHFLPALAIVVFAIASAFVALGLRPNLLEQPWWQLALQCLLWLLCLIVFPAIGLGLLFPSRGARIALAGGAVALTLLATLGLPQGGLFSPDDHFHFHGGCGLMITIYAMVVLLMGVLSGAFVQRRKTSAVYWIAAGISLTGLTAITWQCPMTGVGHVVPNHLAIAAALMLATSAIGVLTHRQRSRSSPPPPDA